MISARALWLRLALVVSLFVGCGDDSQPIDSNAAAPEASGQHSDSHAPTAPADGEQAAAVDLQPTDNARLQEIIGQHKGKIVVVDFWATWCTTCKALMPHTAELQRQHATDLVVITVALDDAEQAPAARQFLAKLDGQFTHLISTSGGGPKSLDEFDLADGVPHYKFYDREGKLAKVLDTDLERLATEESIDAALAELLQPKSAAGE